jgi:cytochrome c peroxidase
MRTRPISRGIAVLLAGVLSGLADDATLLSKARSLFKPLEAVAPEASGPVEELGRALFWDPRLSADGKTACAGCHHAVDGGADRRPFSTDARGRLTARNSQTVFNAMLQPALRWTGDRKSGAHQAERSLTGSMGFTNAAQVLPRLRDHGYEPMFRRAWAADAEPVSVLRYAQALEAYQATLRTPAAFDRYLQGDTGALGKVEKRGLALFLEVGCADCHSGVLLGGEGLKRFGVKKPYWEATGSMKRDDGLAETSGREEDRHRFRVAMLRNIARTGPYFHDGSVADLGQAVRIMADVQLGRRLEGDEASAIVTFLDSLTGEVPANFRRPE